METLETEEVPDATLKVGDNIKILGTWRRITAIRPYRGPLDCVIGIADTVPGFGFSLLVGGWTVRAKDSHTT